MAIVKPVKGMGGPKGIRARFHRVQPPVDCHDMIAVVSFHGKMPDGSAGKAHGRFIGAQAVYWMTFLEAIAVVLDFRDLSYRWGDGMVGALQAIDRRFRDDWSDLNRGVPVKLLGSAKSSGLQSLVSSPDMLFTSMEEAVAACSREVRVWMEAY